jgi:hypothetical protein
MIDNNSLKLLLLDKFLQKFMKPENTAIKSSQKNTYRILPNSMKEMIAVIQLIYNKKVQPVHFYTNELNFSFAKLFNKKTLT